MLNVLKIDVQKARKGENNSLPATVVLKMRLKCFLRGLISS